MERGLGCVMAVRGWTPLDFCDKIMQVGYYRMLLHCSSDAHLH